MTPEFKKKSPAGHVPILETPQGVLFESNAIARYIARIRRDTELLGRTFFENGEVDAWMDFASNDVEVPVSGWLYPILGWATYHAEVQAKVRAGGAAGAERCGAGTAERFEKQTLPIRRRKSAGDERAERGEGDGKTSGARGGLSAAAAGLEEASVEAAAAARRRTGASSAASYLGHSYSSRAECGSERLLDTAKTWALVTRGDAEAAAESKIPLKPARRQRMSATETSFMAAAGAALGGRGPRGGLMLWRRELLSFASPIFASSISLENLSRALAPLGRRVFAYSAALVKRSGCRRFGCRAVGFPPHLSR